MSFTGCARPRTCTAGAPLKYAQNASSSSVADMTSSLSGGGTGWQGGRPAAVV